MKKHPVVHFEMPAKDPKRVMEFYSKTFGWDMQEMGEKMGNYIMAMTTESDEKGSTVPGHINGGFYPLDDSMPTAPSVVIQVDDVEEHMNIVKEAGGEIHGEPMDIPGVGKYVMFSDSEGNRASMLQPMGM